MLSVISLNLTAFSQSDTVALTPANDPHWELKWEENFDRPGKTAAEWNTNYNSWKKYNYFDHFGEPQLLMDTNAFVENGVLVFKIEKDSCQCPPTYYDTTIDGIINYTLYWKCRRQWTDSNYYYKYTIGGIETQLSAAVKYGRFGYIEAKIKYPFDEAFWHAFWTNRMESYDTNRYTNEAEIDILELVGSHYEYSPTISGNSYVTNNIWRCYDTNNIHDYFTPTYIPSFSWNEWHKYAVEWNPKTMIFYVDDKPVNIIKYHGIIDTVKIILGAGINQEWEKIPALAASLDSLTFPQRAEVDYVRVYKLKKNCEEIFEECGYDFSNYDNTVKQKIIIGDGVCSTTISNNIILRATESVEINENFELQEGKELYIEVDNDDCDINIPPYLLEQYESCPQQIINPNN
jgi:beta-glucanase (GH16 family)